MFFLCRNANSISNQIHNQTMKSTFFFRIYIGFSVFYLLLLFIGYDYLDIYLKPILMPLLGFGVYSFKNFKLKNTLLAGLLFSWIGDVILLFSDIAELYFILGLVSFLISHLMYCTLLNEQTKGKTIKNKNLLIIGSLFIAIYLVVIITTLFPYLGHLKVPVLVYACVLLIMLLFAFNGFLVWKKQGKNYVLCGAIIFVFSDTILAFDKFYHPIQKSSFLIMLTYLVAQYLIINGVLKLNSNKS